MEVENGRDKLKDWRGRGGSSSKGWEYGEGWGSPRFSELVENKRLISSRVRIIAKEEWKGDIENKGVSGDCFWKNSGKCEVAENAGVKSGDGSECDARPEGVQEASNQT